MGYARYDAGDWSARSATASATSDANLYKSTTGKAEFLPSHFAVRESRDSALNPNSTPVIVAVDVTGSMRHLARALAREGLGTLFSELLDRSPVPDPHMMAVVLGDVACDRYPIQATQFEADASIQDQLLQLYLEGGGGGNYTESYDAPWLLAAMKTSADCWEKRGKKGFLFTVGDERAPNGITVAQAKQFFDIDLERDLSAKEILAMVEQHYEVFHLKVEGSGTYVGDKAQVDSTWDNLLGERAIPLTDHEKMPEVIVSIMQMIAGVDRDAVVSSWSGSTAVVVSHAVGNLNTQVATTGGGSGSSVVRL